MAKVYYDKDCNLKLLDGKVIGIIGGFGSQGHAHSQNLRDSGCKVIVSELKGSQAWKNAEAAGFEVMDAAAMAKRADIIVMLVQDPVQKAAFIKNPGYWGYDERHPQNKVPYVDNFKVLIIPDIATRMAAVRSGKIDFTDKLTYQQGTTLAKTNPEILQAKLPFSGQGLQTRVDKTQCTDIRVRKALQMALDLKTIAQTQFGGAIDGIPAGMVGPTCKGYAFAYADWPQALKDEYAYNPTKAKQLLADAGYPNGFKITCTAPASSDMDMVQIVKSYFKDIGVDMDVTVMDDVAAQNYAVAGKQEIYWNARGNSGAATFPRNAVGWFTTTSSLNYYHVSDPGYDALYNKMLAATTEDEAKGVIVQLDKWGIEQHLNIVTFPVVIYNVWQPYLKGYSGRDMDNVGSAGGWPWARFWIDQSLKKTMGR